MMVRLLDVAVLQKDVPAEKLTAGMRGTVVAVLESPGLAYEVEFVMKRELRSP